MTNSLAAGLETLRKAVDIMPQSSGVYRMLDAAGDPLYVGKAKNLKKRVNSYTNTAALPLRLQRMVAASIRCVAVRTTVLMYDAFRCGFAPAIRSNCRHRSTLHYQICLVIVAFH